MMKGSILPRKLLYVLIENLINGIRLGLSLGLFFKIIFLLCIDPYANIIALRLNLLYSKS